MKKENLLFLVIPVSQILILLGNITGKRSLNFWGYGGIVLSVAADLLLLYVLIWSSRREKLRKELQELSYLQETERMQNEMLEAKQKELLDMRSDFEKRLEEIREKLKRGEEEAARQEMDAFQVSLDETRPADYCQNAVVNAILSEKEKEFQKLGIKTKLALMIPRGLKLDPLHLCSLFSNLIDNALEALAELPQEKRELELNAEIKGAYLFVKARNTSEKSHAVRKRRKGRGYGTQILQELAETYEGNYQAEYEKGWYTAVVMVKAV